ncbi:MAG: hypothetical protein AAGF01_03725 [Cyanobacteria bacterium P01_G01_bin.38]
MKIRFFLASLVVFGLISLSAPSLPAQATCSSGNQSSSEYIRRDDNRCEGIQQSRNNISRSIDLISLTSSREGALGSTLEIKIPRVAGNQPNVEIIEPNANYQLNNMSLFSSGQFYRFDLSTTELNRHGISLNSLRALARPQGGNQIVYLPVILNNPAPKYRFVFYSSRAASFQRAEIRKDGRPLVSWGAQGRRQGEKNFEWTPGTSSAGRYTFYYEANIHQSRGTPETVRRSIAFEHDPAWLR